MAIKAEHEIHTRRRGLNLGVGLMLAAFVVLVMALTFVKITSTDFRVPASPAKGVGEQISGSGEGTN